MVQRVRREWDQKSILKGLTDLEGFSRNERSCGSKVREILIHEIVGV